MKKNIISVINKKGGVGKTSTIGSVASICAHYGLKVLVVDLDPQCNSTELFYKGPSDVTISDLLLNQEIDYSSIKKAIGSTDYKNIDIIAGDENLDEIGDKILLKNACVSERGNIELTKESQLLLTKTFQIIEKDYDLILIDNTPYFNLISKNALSASNGVLIPVENDGYSYHGLTKLLSKIYDIKGELNKSLDIIGVFFTKVNERTNLFKQLKELFKEELGNKLLDTYIRQDNQVKESNTALIPLFDFAPKANATKDYMKLVSELKLLDEHNQKKLDKDLKTMKR